MSSYIDGLEVGTRTRRALLLLGVESEDQLMDVTYRDIIRLKGIGRKTWVEIADLQDDIRCDRLCETNTVVAKDVYDLDEWDRNQHAQWEAGLRAAVKVLNDFMADERFRSEFIVLGADSHIALYRRQV